VQKLVERYRQSVLKAAVAGELTRGWREKHKGQLESGGVLLQRILKARREAWERAELDKMKAKGILPANDKWKQKYQEPSQPNTHDLPELPEGWVWASVGQMARVQGGFAFKSSDYTTEGVPLVRISNLAEGRIDFRRDTAYLPPGYVTTYNEFLVSPGDVLIAMSGATTGKMATMDQPGPALLNQRVGRLQPSAPGLTNRRFLSLHVERIGEEVLDSAYGAAQPNISPSEIESIALQLSPLSEQSAIVDAVEKHFSAIEYLVADLEHKRKSSQALKLSILHAAFSGQLTSQDPSDEPASVLLQRIAADRGTASRLATKASRKSKTDHTA